MNEDNGRGYGCVVMVIAGVALIVALIALRRWDIPLCALNASDFNVADLLTLLITVLIGWQIWQTIDAKNTLEKFENRTKEYDAKIDRLRQELESKTKLLSAQGERMSFLIDAHSRQHTAQNENMLAASYRMYAEAVELFIRSWMPSMYDPLQSSLQAMTNILNGIEDNKEQWKMFVDDEATYDDLHERIINAISQHQEVLDGITNQIRLLNRNRHRIINNIRTNP